MNILVVGNGFDLAHGLPTTYWDCLNFLDIASRCIEYVEHTEYRSPSPWEDFLHAQSRKNMYDFQDIRKALQPFLREFFNASIGNADKYDPIFSHFRSFIQGNFWVTHFLHCQRTSRQRGDNWIDFEHEIAAVVRQMESMVTAAKSGVWKDGTTVLNPFSMENENFSNHFLALYEYCNSEISISAHHKRDMQSIILGLYQELERFTHAVEIYLKCCVICVKPHKNIQLPDIEAIGRIDRVISFNYTGTFRRYAPDAEACFIHGEIRSDFSVRRSNIVLGIDEYLDETEKDQKTDFLMFKKCYQRIYKATDYNYRKWFTHGNCLGRRSANSAGNDNHFDNNVYIFGHSLDVTDKDALSEIILADYTKTTIFYRSESQLANQVTNLIRIIGIDKLNELARSEPRAIFFAQQIIPK